MNLTGALSCNGTTTELHFKVDFAIFPNGLSLCLMTSTERLTFLEITIGLYIGPYSSSTSLGRASILSANFIRPFIIISFISIGFTLQNSVHAVSCLLVRKLSPSISNHASKLPPKELIWIGDLAAYSPKSSTRQSEQSRFDM